MIYLSSFPNKYAKIVNGVVSEIIDKPDWLHLDGTPVDDDEIFKEDAVWPIVDQKPEYNRFTQSCELQDRENWRIEDAVHTTYIIVDLPIEDSKRLVSMNLDRVKNELTYCGDISYTFPGDVDPDGIQMRHETDWQNIQGFTLSAVLSGPDEVLNFMPSSNNLKQMTPNQVADMSRFIEQRNMAIRNRVWYYKSQLKNLQTLNEIAKLVEAYTNDWSGENNAKQNR